MVSYKKLAEQIGISRPSIGRIVKRENIESVEKYDPATRKITKNVSTEDAEMLIKKYKS